MFAKLFLHSLLTFLAIDSVWISLVASPWMKKVVPHLLADKPSLLAAVPFYLLYLTTLTILFITPRLGDPSVKTLAWQAFLFGMTAYATYDFTNLAVMKGYPLTLALADTLWGGLLTMLTAIIVWQLNHS